MRYGVIRIATAMPAATVQRQLIEMSGCDLMLEERSSTPSGRKVLMRFLHGLKDGDEVVAHDLEAFDVNLGELVRLLRRFHEVGVTLRLVGGEQPESLSPRGPVPRVLALLADHDRRHREPTPPYRRQRTSVAPLTPHQLRFARDMRRQGHSMRAIGLLFQLSPDEITALLGRGSASAADKDAAAPTE